MNHFNWIIELAEEGFFSSIFVAFNVYSTNYYETPIASRISLLEKCYFPIFEEMKKSFQWLLKKKSYDDITNSETDTNLLYWRKEKKLCWNMKQKKRKLFNLISRED
jgi:hypothetical protein